MRASRRDGSAGSESGPPFLVSARTQGWSLAFLMVVAAAFTGDGDSPVRAVAITPASITATSRPAPVTVVSETLPDARQLASGLERAVLARDPAQRETAFAMLLPDLVRRDPQRVVEMLERLPGDESRELLRDEFSRQWSRHDPAALKQWLIGLDEVDRHPAAIMAVRAMAARAPAEAIELASGLGVGFDDGSLEHLAQRWALDDADAAWRWAQAVRGDSSLAPLHERVTSVLSAVR